MMNPGVTTRQAVSSAEIRDPETQSQCPESPGHQRSHQKRREVAKKRTAQRGQNIDHRFVNPITRIAGGYGKVLVPGPDADHHHRIGVIVAAVTQKTEGEDAKQKECGEPGKSHGSAAR